MTVLQNSEIVPKGPTFVPQQMNKLEDTGLSLLWLQDLALKIFYFQGYLTGFKAAEVISLPFVGIVDQILESLKREGWEKDLINMQSPEPELFAPEKHWNEVSMLVQRRFR
jgi:hypothetical protein